MDVRKRVSSVTVESSRAGKRPRQDTSTSTANDDVDMVETTGPVLLPSPSKLVIKAKPSPISEEQDFWGPIGSMPALPGVVFPYFTDMIEGSSDVVIGVCRQYFFENFGSTRQECIARYKDWKRQAMSWSRTPEGLIVQHLFFGIRIAIEAQAILYPLFDQEEYLGFAILGARFFVIAQDRLFRPLSNAALIAEVSELSGHAKALQEILAYLEGEDYQNVYLWNGMIITPSFFKSPREFHQYLHVHVEITDADGEKISKLVNRLCFNQTYKKVTADTLVWMLDLIATGAEIPDDTPMFLGNRSFMQRTNVYKVLSAFGPLVPSFSHEVGRKIRVPHINSVDDTLTKVDPKTKHVALPVLQVYHQPIMIGLQSWRRSAEARSIFQVTSERAGKSRYSTFSGDARDKIWQSIRRALRDGDESDEEKDAEKDKGKGVAAGDLVLGVESGHGWDDL